MTPRLAASLGAVALFSVELGGCVPAPTYARPIAVGDPHAALVPGFDSSATQVARWICLPAVDPKGETMSTPRVDIVLYKDEKGDLLLHEIDNDWVMTPTKTIPGGGVVYEVSVPFMSDTFTIPPDYTEYVDREWHFAAVSYIYKVKQKCARGPAVRFL